MSQYLPVVCLLVLAVLFGALSFLSSAGAAPPIVGQRGSARMQHRAQPRATRALPVTFYVVAMLFVMFDIRLIFIYPFAVDREFLGSYGFWEMVAFSAVSFLAFVYVVARGALDWGPVVRHHRLDDAVSADRTLGTTIRRVGTEGRVEDESTAA